MTVRVAIQIRNLADVDEIKEQWQVTGTLISSWRNRKAPWRPQLVFRNEVEPAKLRDVESYVEPDGTEVLWQDFSATLSTDLDLRRFPFDVETLPMVVEPTGAGAQGTVLSFDRALSSVPHDRYAGLAQWNPVSLTARPYVDTAAQRDAHGLAFDFLVQRNSSSYVWKFIIPLILLVIVSWVSFWLSHEEFTTKDQLGTAVSTLLIIVAFNFVSSSLMPHTNYMTYIDALIFSSFVFVVVSIAFIIASHTLEVRLKSTQRALMVRRLAGVALPIAFLLTQGALIALFRV